MKVVKATRRTKEMRPRDDKLRELILYIATRSQGDESFGSVKLNKLLFNADFVSYAERGEAITNQEYQALPQGPCPRRLTPILHELERKGEVETRETVFHGKRQKRTSAKREPDLSLFDPAEIELVNRVIEQWWGKTAKEISDASHTFIGWKLADRGESIPYSVALVGDRQPTEQERTRGLELESLARACLAPYEQTH